MARATDMTGRRPAGSGEKNAARSRRWRIPPAILLDANEPLEGVKLLQEHEGARALVLWQVVRAVHLWAQTTEEGARSALFTPDSNERLRTALVSAGFDRDTGRWLDLLITSLFRASGESGSESVSDLCHRVSQWASGRGHTESAVAFARAAALANPADPHAALETGRAAAALGRDALAESWLQRAIALARRQRAWEPYGAAYVALARLSERRGDGDLARRRYVVALRVARRGGLVLVHGDASHGLARLAFAEGILSEARRFMTRALRHVGARHPSRPAVLHDHAELLLREAEGFDEPKDRRAAAIQAASALREFLASAPDISRPRTYAHALLATAAALADSHVGLRDAWTAAWELASGCTDHRLRVKTLLELARAAHLAGDGRRAIQAESAARRER
jgi:tetratricopeptide (TPR) repeat protein